jgi:hypothetical protein
MARQGHEELYTCTKHKRSVTIKNRKRQTLGKSVGNLKMRRNKVQLENFLFSKCMQTMYTGVNVLVFEELCFVVVDKH